MKSQDNWLRICWASPSLRSRLHAVNVGPRKQNVQIGGYRATVMPELIERLEAAAHYDRALYAHACELFAEQWAHYRVRSRRTIRLAPRLCARIA